MILCLLYFQPNMVEELSLRIEAQRVENTIPLFLALVQVKVKPVVQWQVTAVARIGVKS